MRVVVVEIVDFQPPRSSFSGIPAIRRRTTMNIRFRSVSTALAVLLAMAGTATAATVHYDIDPERSEEHTSELQSLMRISYAVFCLKKKKKKIAQQRQNMKL